MCGCVSVCCLSVCVSVKNFQEFSLLRSPPSSSSSSSSSSSDMINNSTAIGFTNSQKETRGYGCESELCKDQPATSPTARQSENVAIITSSIGNSGSSSQLSSVIGNLSNNSDIAAALSFAPPASATASASASPSSPAATAAATLTLFPGSSPVAGALHSPSGPIAAAHHATHKSYPPINSAYWLPSSHPSPYAVPGRSCSSSRMCPSPPTSFCLNFTPLSS